jgi:sirohydrochlorin cobaltochelatase
MTGRNQFSRAGRPTATQPSQTPGRAVILAAHGSRRRIQAVTIVKEHARRLQADYDVHEVAVAFRQGEPPYSEVMDSIVSREVTVVPFFCADGYFTQTVLPRELSLNRRYSQLRVQFTDPVGTHPQISGLVQRRTREIFRRFQLTPERAALVIVGHGTPRHSASTSSTLKLVEQLKRAGPCPNVHPAFLDELPRLEEVFQDLPQDEIVVIPFFMGESYHVLQDIPRHLGLSKPVCDQSPVESTHAGRRVIVDRAVGLDPGLTAVMAELVGCSPTGCSDRMSQGVA